MLVRQRRGRGGGARVLGPSCTGHNGDGGARVLGLRPWGGGGGLRRWGGRVGSARRSEPYRWDRLGRPAGLRGGSEGGLDHPPAQVKKMAKQNGDGSESGP